jgi:tetraacyldisaccharide 4'-kinase
LIRILSSAYGAVAAWRRRWYAADPSRRRRLQRPVISVGNVRVGGSGKTPVVAHIARLLLEQGERPVILTRGYGRRLAPRGVTIVSDGTQILAGVDTAGDEPLLLARELPGVPVLVSADRYRSGCVAEAQLGATVHLLDDGFQHFRLERDVDLVLMSEEDLTDTVLPAGRLREPIAAASRADAALVLAGYTSAADRIGRAAGVPLVFRITRTLGAPRRIAGARDTVVVPSGTRVFAIAGIARPERFFGDLISVGWDVVGSMPFGDHHRFTRRDVTRIAAAARSSAASIVLTTEKDAMRLAAAELGDLPIAAVPLHVGVEPADAFRDWLVARLRTTRTAAPGTMAPGTLAPGTLAPGTPEPGIVDPDEDAPPR